MKISELVLAIVVGIASAFNTVCASDELPYRLAGIISRSDGGWLVLIELSDGKQRIFRKQDSIEGGRIVEVSRRAIKIQYPDKEYLLQLKGSGTLGFVQDTQETSLRIVNIDLTKGIVGELNKLLPRHYKGNEKQLIAKINSLLELPEGAWIIEVDDKVMASPVDGLNAMLNSLNKGELSRLTISGVSDLHAIYLTPPIEVEP